jgi:hypothetical protein
LGKSYGAVIEQSRGLDGSLSLNFLHHVILSEAQRSRRISSA